MNEGAIVRFSGGHKQYRVLAIHEEVAILQPCAESWVKRIEAYIHSLIVERPGQSVVSTPPGSERTE